MPMFPAWLSRTAFERKVREEFLAHLHQRAPHWRGNYSEEEDMFLLFDSRVKPDDKNKPEDIKLNPAKIYLGAQGERGLAGRRQTYDFWLDQLEQITADIDLKLSLAAHGDRILPRIVHPDLVAQLGAQSDVPQRAWGWTGLRIVYVLDRPDSVAYLNRDMAEDLGLNDVELHDLALSNLRKVFDPEPILNLLKNDDGDVLFFEDGHGAARALLIGEHLGEGESCALVLPDQNTLIVMSPPRDNDWSPQFQIVAGIPTALLNRPIKITAHGVELPS
jgi:hypothetical protein